MLVECQNVAVSISEGCHLCPTVLSLQSSRRKIVCQPFELLTSAFCNLEIVLQFKAMSQIQISGTGRSRLFVVPIDF